MAFPHSRETRWRNPSAPWTIKAPANLTRVSSENLQLTVSQWPSRELEVGKCAPASVCVCVCVCVCVRVCSRAGGEHAHQCI